MGDWTASWRVRYVGPFESASADAACAADPQYCYPLGFQLHAPQLQRGLRAAEDQPRIEVGVDNALTDKQPPLLFQNNVLNANTDVSTFDTIGRYFWARYTVKF